MLKYAFDKQFQGAIYLRLSKEDGSASAYGEKAESNSISNQRMLIRDFLKNHPEITVVREYCDDGFTGANFERPEFQKMMDAVRNREIDCIVVKDLSRFGREYIDSGHYLQKVFPALGVRFIAINDNYDNAQPGTIENDLVLPFKNLMNDSYCRDISIKVRTNLDAKRRSGQFVGSRIVYGYLRCPDDKNRLVVDPYAAGVVQDIFKWKIEGMSPLQISDRLNAEGILSPIEYKKANGSRQRTCFQTNPKAMWSAVAIYRILHNEIYTGVLLQGKTTTPNHKIKKTIQKDRSEWSRTENAHEAIISSVQFDLVQQLLKNDTRRPAGGDTVYPLAGKIVCADCGSSMIRKTTRTDGKEYAYFLCSEYRKNHTCTAHRISEKQLYDTVLAVLQAHISAALDLSRALSRMDALSWEGRELEKIKANVVLQEEQIDKSRRMKTEAYEDFRNQLLSREEYETFRDEFDRKIKEAKEIIMRLHSEQNRIAGGFASQQGWIKQFQKYENIQQITRPVVVHLIDQIVIHEEKEIEVRLLHQEPFASLMQHVKNVRGIREAM